MHTLVRRAALGTAALLAVAGLAACGGSSDSGSSSAASGGDVSISDAWTKSTDGPMTGSFGVLANSGSQDITVTAASSTAAGMVELHETVMVDGAMQMQAKEGGFVIPAGGSFALEPGGNHVMLMGLTGAIKPGDEVPITLTLSNGQSLEYTAIAKEFTGANESYSPGDGGMDMDSDMGSDSDMDMDNSSESMSMN